MSKPKIVLYFDLHSPFAFLVFHTLRVRFPSMIKYNKPSLKGLE